MSMRNYPVNIYGFYVDHEVAAYAYLKIDRDRNDVPDEIQHIIDEGKFHDLARAGQASGRLQRVSDVESVMDEDETHYCSEFERRHRNASARTDRKPHLQNGLRRIYRLYRPKEVRRPVSCRLRIPEELLQEFKTSMKKQGIELPDDFDWWAHIVHIYGTTFG